MKATKQELRTSSGNERASLQQDIRYELLWRHFPLFVRLQRPFIRCFEGRIQRPADHGPDPHVRPDWYEYAPVARIFEAPSSGTDYYQVYAHTLVSHNSLSCYTYRREDSKGILKSTKYRLAFRTTFCLQRASIYNYHSIPHARLYVVLPKTSAV